MQNQNSSLFLCGEFYVANVMKSFFNPKNRYKFLNKTTIFLFLLQVMCTLCL